MFSQIEWGSFFIAVTISIVDISTYVEIGTFAMIFAYNAYKFYKLRSQK